MKILGLIPARGGSKGVPKKNSRLLGNRPLIAYTIFSAKESRLLESVVVSTDSREIFSIAESLNLKPPFLRPDALAGDHISSLEVVQHALDFFEQENVFFDAICLLQPTSPFRENGFIDRAIAKFTESGADSLVSVLAVPHEYNPHWVFEPGSDGLLRISTGDNQIIPRRQDLPKAFHRDGSVYITRTNVIKNGSLYGESIACIESNPALYVNIDTLEDWGKGELLLQDPLLLRLIE